ncbi:N-acylneuraminate cytidylyltransferase, partial [Haemophilus influenzae]
LLICTPKVGLNNQLRCRFFMTKYNFFSSNKSSSFIFKIVKIVDFPAGIFNLPAEHCDIGLINLIILESMA